MNPKEKFHAMRALTGITLSLLLLAMLHLSGGGGIYEVVRAWGAENRSAAAKAFISASRVLLHPRCMNCHPAEDAPLQGDDSHRHFMRVQRGPGGMGENGLWCSTCHQTTNLPGAHMPPGAPGWQLPTRDMPMVFEKKTPRELCLQMKDPAQNGNRNLNEVLEHVKTAPLVLWGWHPGDGRDPVPISHEAFVKSMTEWVEKGAACPEE